LGIIDLQGKKIIQASFVGAQKNNWGNMKIVRLEITGWIVCLMLGISVISITCQANEVQNVIKRVPAEWEPQEAIWMQWPGYLEKDS
jgi:hypothetical protein